MLLLLLGGSILNAFVISFYGIQYGAHAGEFFLVTDWRLYLAWLLLYPLVWAVVTTHSMPLRLRASPLDLGLATTLLLPLAYQGNYNWIRLTLVNGWILLMFGILQTMLVGPIVGLGEGTYYYSSFLMKKERVSDFREYYENEQYRRWLELPDLEIVVEKKGEPDKVILKSSNDDDIGAFLFLSNHKRGLLIQTVSFEKGKYSVFQSKTSDFVAQQITKTVISELKAKAEPFEDETEKGNALRVALHVTRSVAALRGIQKRDQIILTTGAILLTGVGLGWAFFGWSTENSYTSVALILLGVIAELSYRRLKLTRIWRGAQRRS